MKSCCKLNVILYIYRSDMYQEQASTSDKLLNSIIQARCLSNEQERSAMATLKKQSSTAQNDYYDNTDLKSTEVVKSSENESKLRKSITSKNERDSAEHKTNTKHEGQHTRTKERAEEEIDKPWISYLRNLRIPMM